MRLWYGLTLQNGPWVSKARGPFPFYVSGRP
jgi:hypothetical protein